jgi:pyroglutamyl-peptidase
MIALLLVVMILAAGATPSSELGKYSDRPPLRVLISGFEPFGDNPRNPTGELAQRYSTPTRVGNVVVKGVELPVVYWQAWDKLKPEIESFHPDFILSLGLSSGDNAVRLERVAINYDRGYSDNLGKMHLGSIVNGGEKKIESDLPMDQIAKVLQDSGVPAHVSNDAGGYLCNHIFYQVMNHTLGHPNQPGGFIHLPDWSIDGNGPKTLNNVLKILLEQIDLRYRRAALMEFEPKHGAVNENLNKMVECIQAAPQDRVNLIAFPEMSTTGFVWNSKDEITGLVESIEGNSMRTLTVAAASSGVWVAFGWPEKDLNTSAFCNSYALIDPNGKIVLIYHKHHLWGQDYNWANASTDIQSPYSSPFGNITFAICHDVVYPDSYETIGDNFGQLLLIGTNWVGDTPITEFLIKYRPANVLVLAADRRGSEGDIVYPGNTCVIRRDGIIVRGSNANIAGIPALVYSFLATEQTNNIDSLNKDLQSQDSS